MNLSTWASGSGYVPSCSIGFCVARTRKGASSGKVSSPMVTCSSCIASSSALCTFAGARLTSSARIRFEKIRPLLNAELPGPLVVYPGAYEVRGQKVGRELDTGEPRLDRVANRLDQEGLGKAWHALQQNVAVGQKPHESALHKPILTHDGFPNLSLESMDEPCLLLDLARLFGENLLYLRHDDTDAPTAILNHQKLCAILQIPLKNDCIRWCTDVLAPIQRHGGRGARIRQ